MKKELRYVMCMYQIPTRNVNITYCKYMQKERRDQEWARGGGREWKGGKKGIKTYYVYEPTPQCKHYVVQMHINKKICYDMNERALD